MDKKNHENLKRVLYKVSQCIDYQNLYALEEEMNKVGLSVQTTSNNRMILCRLFEGKVVTEKVIDDYIFIGSLNDATKELSESQIQKISDFIRNRSGPSGKVENLARVWRNGVRMYDSIMVVNEDVSKVADDMDHGLIIG